MVNCRKVIVKMAGSLKIGDKVKITADSKTVDYPGWNSDMNGYKNQMAEIKDIIWSGNFKLVKLDIDNGMFNWSVHWLTKATSTKAKAKVKVKPVVLIKPSLSPHAILGQAKAKTCLKVAIKHSLPVLLVGDTGTGKTTIVKELAEQAGHKWLRFNLTGETTVDDFVGKYTLSKGATIWQDGILLMAMKAGYWLIVDEINAALPEILFTLHSLLDDDRSVTVVNHNAEVVKPHKNFRFFATMNPVDEYAGTKDLNKAFKSRFNMVIELKYPSPKTEADVISRKLGLDIDIAKQLTDIGIAIRHAKADNKLFYTCSTRDLIQAGQLLPALGMSKALEVAIINKANGDSKAIKQIIADITGEYQQTETVLDTLNLDEINQHIANFRTKEAELKTKEQALIDKEVKMRADIKSQLITELTKAPIKA